MVGMKIGLIIALAFFSTQVFALTVTGSSVIVHQGDTFTIKSISPDEKLYKVRLSDVDTPELKQPFGIKAKEFTAAQTFGKEIRVEYQFADFYGRLIGVVILPGGKVLNEELVRNGLAWHYRVGTSPSASLERLQYEAWEKKLGIWVEPSPTPPWQFRRENAIPLPPVEADQMDYDLILNENMGFKFDENIDEFNKWFLKIHSNINQNNLHSEIEKKFSYEVIGENYKRFFENYK